MKSIETRIILLNTIDKYIYEGKTGSPEEFAAKLGCTKQALFGYLRDMRKKLAEKNVRIYYDYVEKSYRYSVQGHFTVGWQWISF